VWIVRGVIVIAACGVFFGGVVVLTSAPFGPTGGGEWPVLPARDAGPSPFRGWSTRRKVLALVFGLVAAGCVGLVGFAVGAIHHQLSTWRQEIHAATVRLRPVLSEPRFGNVEAVFSSDAECCLIGTVDSREHYRDLEGRIRFLFGDEEARVMMRGVEVARELPSAGNAPDGLPERKWE